MMDRAQRRIDRISAVRVLTLNTPCLSKNRSARSQNALPGHKRGGGPSPEWSVGSDHSRQKCHLWRLPALVRAVP